MKKKIGILVVIILSLSMVLVGCSSKSPSDVVDKYFTKLKKGNSKQADEFIKSIIYEIEEETLDIEETDEIMDEALKLYMSKIDAKVLSEEVYEDEATVDVEIYGPNFTNISMKVVGVGLLDTFSGQELEDDYLSTSFLEKVKESESEVRTGKVNLKKEDKEWKINLDDNISDLVLGKFYSLFSN